LAQQQQQQQQREKEAEILEENIYDFGGVHVKSCATIALKKSIERGMLPPDAANLLPISHPPLAQSGSFDQSSDTQKVFKHQPQGLIASRMMIFQQQQQQQQQSLPGSPKIFSNQSQDPKMFAKDAILANQAPQQV
jgi:hypothetical protein